MKKTAYELRESQVSTPAPVVSLFWKLVRESRPTLGRVLDLGAGDARFAVGGHYKSYDGVEIDPAACRDVGVNPKINIYQTCAFRLNEGGYDACIGNPPYVRHHDIETPWREQTCSTIERALGFELSGYSNLYLYFLCLALMKSRSNGLAALVMPFEWVSRPSASPIRDYIKASRWGVSVFRFQQSIFEGVLTTASISIIDKGDNSASWKYHDILPDLVTRTRNGVSGNKYSILAYSQRGKIWARRGISPGGQENFVLRESERVAAGLRRSDVMPCVTTLRHLSGKITELNRRAFERHFVQSNKRCWLLKSSGRKISRRVQEYLSKIKKEALKTYACGHQKPWYRYENPPVPRLLFHSGFVKRGPKILVNSVGAQAVGSIYGVHASRSTLRVRALREYLARFNFERRVVAHARTLRKVEVAQLNSVLDTWQKGQN